MSAYSWGQGVHKRVNTRDVPEGVKRLVDERQGGRFCVDCRALELVTPDDVALELDHKQPFSRGGDNHHLNLEWRCVSHNRGRGARPLGKPRLPAWARR